MENVDFLNGFQEKLVLNIFGRLTSGSKEI